MPGSAALHVYHARGLLRVCLRSAASLAFTPFALHSATVLVYTTTTTTHVAYWLQLLRLRLRYSFHGSHCWFVRSRVLPFLTYAVHVAFTFADCTNTCCRFSRLLHTVPLLGYGLPRFAFWLVLVYTTYLSWLPHLPHYTATTGLVGLFTAHGYVVYALFTLFPFTTTGSALPFTPPHYPVGSRFVYRAHFTFYTVSFV